MTQLPRVVLFFRAMRSLVCNCGRTGAITGRPPGSNAARPFPQASALSSQNPAYFSLPVQLQQLFNSCVGVGVGVDVGCTPGATAAHFSD